MQPLINKLIQSKDYIPSFPTSEDRFELARVTTLLLLIIVVPSIWFIQIPITILGIYGIVLQRWRQSNTLWLFLFTFLFFECYYLWYSQDNHKYLISYWCLAVALALKSADPAEYARKNARILIGLCFLIAVIAKLVSASYMDGTFFNTTLMEDQRFRALTTRVLGVEEETFASNAKVFEGLISEDGPSSSSANVNFPPQVRNFSVFMTIWTLIIETAIAITFLLPSKYRIRFLRNHMLCVFILTTYAVANVIGFGWVLATMGIAQLEDKEKRFASIYFFLIVLLHIYRIPWSALTS